MERVQRMKTIYTQDFEKKFFYTGNDLGAVYEKERTVFRVWAPEAEYVQLNLYRSGDGDTLIRTEHMEEDVQGTWLLEQKGDLSGVYYTYLVTRNKVTTEAADPYAKAAGVNGERSMVINLFATNPEGFAGEDRPELLPITDSVIYEAHVRDLTVDVSSGVTHKGKFLGVAETGTKNSYGMPTGMDHMKELGVTHVQLLPIYDYATVDERYADAGAYNWGYDPLNYNIPEGSYATDPFHGEVRILELKQMIQAFHANGIRVVMDVVYNHTYSTESFCFQKIVPDYFFRKDQDGYSNGSACGNETASERWMVRKYIVDSICYWAREYHMDGFRFDLMGILDTETMRAVRSAVDEINPGIILYGEGWAGGACALHESRRYIKAHTWQIERFGAFNDDIRDAVKGSVFLHEEKGFVNGEPEMEQAIRFGVTGAVRHPQVRYNGEAGFWAGSPSQSINYVSCHDNYTLWDKLNVSRPDASQEELLAMNRLTAAIIYTAQGVPLMQAGEEFLRSKPVLGIPGAVSDNSYNLPDFTNSIKWDTIRENEDTYAYYRGLIAFRKAHGALRLKTAKEVQSNLVFHDLGEKNLVAYTIQNSPNGETAKELFVVYNANPSEVIIEMPDTDIWNVCIDGVSAGTGILAEVSGKLTVPAISAMVLIK